MVYTTLLLPEVKAQTGFSWSTIYLKMAEGSFPEPISLGARSVGCIGSEVDAGSRSGSSKAAQDYAPPARSRMPEATGSRRIAWI